MPQDEQLALTGDTVQESADFEEHSLIIPATLPMDPEATGEAVGLFVVMKSYGKRAHASVESYCERTGWGPDRVRTWQDHLQKIKWMTLLQEGRPPRKGEKTGTPRLWWMNWTKGEAPPLDAFMHAPRVGVLPGLGKHQGTENTHPKQGLSSNSRVSRIKTAGAVVHPQQTELWHGLQAIWLKKFPQDPLKWPDPKNPVTAITGFQKKLGALIDTFGVEGTLSRWTNLVNDGFNRPSLRVFLADAERYTQARSSKGQGSYMGQPTRDFEG